MESDSVERDSQGGLVPVDTRTLQELQDAIADLREERYRMQEDRQTNYSQSEMSTATAAPPSTKLITLSSNVFDNVSD